MGDRETCVMKLVFHCVGDNVSCCQSVHYQQLTVNAMLLFFSSTDLLPVHAYYLVIMLCYLVMILCYLY